MNTDQHGMIWCRNFDGGRSYTNLLMHSWVVLYEDWLRSNLLKGIQYAAGVSYANCVTFTEVADLLAASVATGGVNADGNAALSVPLADANAAFKAGDYKRAASQANYFVKLTERTAVLQERREGVPRRRARTGQAPLQGAGADQLDERPAVTADDLPPRRSQAREARHSRARRR